MSGLTCSDFKLAVEEMATKKESELDVSTIQTYNYIIAIYACLYAV